MRRKAYKGRRTSKSVGNQLPAPESPEDGAKTSQPTTESQPEAQRSVTVGKGPDENDKTNAWRSVETLLPSNLHRLASVYHFEFVSIMCSSKVEQRVNMISNYLKSSPDTLTNKKSTIVAIRARAAAAGKLVAATEITKHALSREKTQCFQYSSIGGIVEEVKEQNSSQPATSRETVKRSSDGLAKPAIETPALDDGTNANAEAEQAAMEDSPDVSDDSEAFANTRASSEGDFGPAKKKLRKIPTLTIFLSLHRIPELEKLFG